MRDMDDPFAAVGGRSICVWRARSSSSRSTFGSSMKPKLSSTPMMPPRLGSRSKTVTSIAVVVDVGHLEMRDFDEDQVARQHAVALPHQLHQRGRAVVRECSGSGDISSALRSMKASALAMQVDEFGHRHRRPGRIGGESRLAAPSPGRHHQETPRPTGSGTKPPSRNFSELATRNAAVDGRQRAPDQSGARRAPAPVAPRDRDHRQRGDDHHARDREAVGGRESAGEPKPSTSTMQPM